MNPDRAQKKKKLIVIHHFQEVKKLYEELDISSYSQRITWIKKGCGITGVNAVGIAIPPMISFKAIGNRSKLALNLPAGTKINMASKGSMTSSLFVEFIQDLAQHKVSGKCLLIFDGTECHLSYEALEEAETPLEKSVNRSFEYHWDEEVMNYLCNSQQTAKFSPKHGQSV